MDLGINTDAVCAIMRSDGTVLGRKFINFPSEKDQMYSVLGRISRFQREHGSGQVQSRWNYARRLNMELSRKVASAITTYAQNNHADVIVFEYLKMKGKVTGKRGRSFICGENGIFRSYANIRRTGQECGYPEYVHGIPADLHMMELVKLFVILKSQPLHIYDRKTISL